LVYTTPACCSTYCYACTLRLLGSFLDHRRYTLPGAFCRISPLLPVCHLPLRLQTRTFRHLRTAVLAYGLQHVHATAYCRATLLPVPGLPAAPLHCLWFAIYNFAYLPLLTCRAFAALHLRDCPPAFRSSRTSACLHLPLLGLHLDAPHSTPVSACRATAAACLLLRH